MSRTIALLVAAVLGAGCNGLELPTSPASVNPPVPITLAISHVGPKEGWPFITPRFSERASTLASV